MALRKPWKSVIASATAKLKQWHVLATITISLAIKTNVITILIRLTPNSRNEASSR